MAVKQGAGLAVKLAAMSSSAFITELAKLEVSLKRGGISLSEVLAALRRLEGQLKFKKAHSEALETEGGARVGRVVGVFGDAIKNPRECPRSAVP